MEKIERFENCRIENMQEIYGGRVFAKTHCNDGDEVNKDIHVVVKWLRIDWVLGDCEGPN